MKDIRIEHLNFHIGQKHILKDVNLTIDGSKFLGLIGPNGSGKSTLLKHLYRVNHLQEGHIEFDGMPIEGFPLHEAAKKIAVMSQFHGMDFDFTVHQIALMGRTPYKKSFQGDTPEDLAKVEAALTQVGMWQAKDRYFSSLSGGEQQRVMLARVLVQEPEFLILDEPTNHLDITYQIQLLKIVKGLGVGIVSALHDLNLASMFCDEICVMKDGHIIKHGTPKEVLTEELIGDVYGVKANVHYNEQDLPTIIYQV